MFQLQEYLLSQIPPDKIKQWGLDKLIDKTTTLDIIPNISTKKQYISNNFFLPITYLDPIEIYPLSPIVSNDLELLRPDSDFSVYENLFQPSNEFGRNMIPAWSKYFTTNVSFLQDSQQVLYDMEKLNHLSLHSSEDTNHTNYNKIMEIWNDIKEDSSFLEKYGYMEWTMLLHLNESSSFLQCISLANVISPLISLFLPLIFIILPFIILKIQQIPINFTIYLEVLKSVAKNHFIGKALLSMTSLSWDKVAYLIMTLGFYGLQIYQNITICYRFYNNIIKINEHLMYLKNYVNDTITKMSAFLDIIHNKHTYKPFYNIIREHCHIFECISEELTPIYPFKNSLLKFNDVGYYLKIFYKLYSNIQYENSIRYSIGFHGYLDNLFGVYNNLISGKISISKFSTKNKCIFKDQYYPPLMNENPVKNDCSFEKNIIISSPNKSGKTTILKTTALNIIFTQQLGCGFYSLGVLSPYSHIHSYLNIPDTSGRDSLFQAESRRCKEIIDTVSKYNDKSKYRHFCIFDELYSGTNPEEATRAGYAFLKYLGNFENVNYILTTHYIKICKKFLKSGRVQNYKMDVQVLENGEFNYTYKIKKGISKIKGAIRVMKDMEYPTEMIQTMLEREPMVLH